MPRTSTLISVTLGAVLWAATAVAAEVVGTIVSTDPTQRTVVVTTPDGQRVVYQTVETTRVQQGDAIVELKNLQPGSRVQIITDPTPPVSAPVPGTGQPTIVYPVASGIVIAPTESPKDSVARPNDRKSDKDVDVDIDEEVEADD